MDIKTTIYRFDTEALLTSHEYKIMNCFSTLVSFYRQYIMSDLKCLSEFSCLW